MVAVPGLTPVTTPVELTLATEALLEVNVAPVTGNVKVCPPDV